MAPSSTFARLAGATLRAADGTSVVASSLWEKQPAFIYCIRRPGCVLCRDEALKLWEEHKQLEQAGMRVVCVVHEWIDREMAAFLPKYWGGSDVYHDTDKAFYEALGDGQLVRKSVLSLLNPWDPSWRRIGEAKKNVEDSNLSGEGSIMGGLLVVKSSGIAWAHVERRFFGDFPPVEEVVAAATKAAAA